MDWLCQLKDGYMLRINKGYVERVHTGYPYPDINGGQIERISNYLEISEVNLSSFVEEAIQLEYPISEVNFKNHFYPNRFSMEKETGAINSLSSAFDKLKFKNNRKTDNMLLTVKANSKSITDLKSLDDLKRYFLGNAYSLSSYEPTDEDLKLLSGISFNVIKRNGLIYVRAFTDDMIKIRGFLDRCYEVIDFDYIIEHDSEFAKTLSSMMYILHVEDEMSVMFFGKKVTAPKIYEHITSLADKDSKCVRHDKHYVIRSEEYNLVLEFNSYKIYSLNVGNGNWEEVKQGSRL